VTALDNGECISTNKYIGTAHVEADDIRGLCMLASMLVGEGTLAVDDIFVALLKSLVFVVHLFHA